jgi:hypothetical protein
MLLLLIPPTLLAMQSSEVILSNPMDDRLVANSNTAVIVEKTNTINEGPQDGVRILSEEIETPNPASGTLNPLQVEQSGYYSTGNISARTDTNIGTENAFFIDIEHDWKASTAEIDVWNLERMYVVNGSFEQGIAGYTLNPNGTLEGFPYGWSAISNNTDLDQTQLVSYEDSSRRYVSVQNQAEVTNNPQHIYTHYAGTTVFWNQTIDVTPYTTEFLLSFDYLYLQGLLNPSFSGDFSLQVFIDNVSVYNVDLPSLAERGTWFNTGRIPVSVSVTPGLIQFMIGLVINNTMEVDGDIDYDLDSFPDGATNTQYISVYVDDVSLIAATPPDCEEVALEFSVNESSIPVTGTLGSGFGQIVNQSYWDTSTVSFSINSNTSVSLDYSARLLNHRFLNSSYTTDTVRQGVAYTIESGKSSSLELFTYLGFLGVYEELTLTIYHAQDWENFTVLDPFLSDVTSSCTLTSDLIKIPESILDRLGWWKVTCDTPNYASSAVVERYDSGITDWVNESVFHSNDNARLSISLGTATDTPALIDLVNFTWALPNCTTWHKSTTTGGVDGNTSSPSVIFGPSNTTAGVWGVKYLWSNGSELAYDCAVFTLHHIAALESVYSDTLDTVVGQPVSVFVRFVDAENGLFILNDDATVVGNWSGSDIEFTPDIVKNWWQADFDTALVGAGSFTVNIVSAAPYFETVPLVITINSHFLTTLTPPTGPLTPLVYGRQYSYDFFYSMSYNGTGIDGADVDVTEEGSEWTSVVNTGSGHYNLSIAPMAIGDFSIRLTFAKEGYESKSHVLSFLVNRVPVEVESISNLVAAEYTQLHVDVHIVESDTRNPVTTANVTMGVYSPGGRIYFHSNMSEISPGVYSVIVPMPQSGSGTYSVSISVEKENHEMVQSFTAALVPTFDIIQTLRINSLPISFSVVIIVSAVAGLRMRSRRIRKKYSTALAIKNRFNDANNLLGFLVLHKLSGVPIYSKILKGGFEEAMLSAFITAIMHFRAEFEAGGERPDYAIVPISEVIRTVPTEHLICAFITVSPPSKELENRMKNYARAIGMMLDESLAEPAARAIDIKIRKTFEWMFDDFMDGHLVRRYKVGEKKFPKQLRFIEKAIPIEDRDGSFNLQPLVRLLISSGHSEDDVYIRIFKAIEEEYITPVYQYDNDISPKSD